MRRHVVTRSVWYAIPGTFVPGFYEASRWDERRGWRSVEAEGAERMG